jgi:hypothetical protein
MTESLWQTTLRFEAQIVVNKDAWLGCCDGNDSEVIEL